MNKHEQSGNANAPLDEALMRHVTTINWEYKHGQPNYLNDLQKTHEKTFAYDAGIKFRKEATAFAYRVNTRNTDADIRLMDREPYNSGLLIGLAAATKGLFNVDRANIYSDALLADSFESFSIGAHVDNPQQEYEELQNKYVNIAAPFADVLKRIRAERHKSDVIVRYEDMAVACGYALYGAHKLIQRYRETDSEGWHTDMHSLSEEFTRRQKRGNSKGAQKAFDREYQDFFPDLPKEQSS